MAPRETEAKGGAPAVPPESLATSSRDELERLSAALDVVLGCVVAAEEFDLITSVRCGPSSLSVTVSFAAAGAAPPVAEDGTSGGDTARATTPAAVDEIAAFTAPATSAAPASEKAMPRNNLPINAWTTEEDDAAIKMAGQGKFCAEIGEVLGRSERGVQQRLQKLQKAGKLDIVPDRRRAERPSAARAPETKATRGRPTPPAPKVRAAPDRSEADVQADAPTGRGSPVETRQDGERSAPEERRPSPNGKKSDGAGDAAAVTTSVRAARPEPARQDHEASLPTKDAPSWKPSHLDRRPPTEAEVAQAEVDLEILELLGAGQKAGAVAGMLEIDKAEVIGRYRKLNPGGTIAGQTAAIERVRGIVRSAREVRA